MVHRTPLRPHKTTPQYREDVRDFLTTLRPRNSRTQQQRLTLWKQRASQRLPLLGE